MGLILAARLAGERLREHVQGTDLVHMLAREGARLGHRWFLLGGFGDVGVRAARAAVRELSPRLRDDRSLSSDIEAVATAIRDGSLVAAAEAEVGALL